MVYQTSDPGSQNDFESSSLNQYCSDESSANVIKNKVKFMTHVNDYKKMTTPKTA